MSANDRNHKMPQYHRSNHDRAPAFVSRAASFGRDCISAGRQLLSRLPITIHRAEFVAFAAIVGLLVSPAILAQLKPIMTIDEDCQAFAIGQDNRIVYAVPHIKRMKKVMIERDDVWIAEPNGRSKKIVDVDKFMPATTPSTYIVNALAWAPDSRHIVMNMTTMPPELRKESQDDSANTTGPAGGGKAIALLDDGGQEIKVTGSKTRFIENVTNGTWLADGVDVVYLIGGGPYQIGRVNPSNGQSSVLFAGHNFDSVVWDAKRNRAFGVGGNLSVLGKTVIVQLDLIHETVSEIARLDNYRGQLNVSPSGKKVAFFEDGDTIQVVDLANPKKPVRVNAGYGRFGWSKDERRLLLKRGPDEKSNDLVWVGIADGSFTPILHDLLYHDFAITPDGSLILVSEPGKRSLKMFPLE
jgi:hypothetical protein